MNTARLLKLADHLENGQLSVEKFDMTHYWGCNVYTGETTGCALGECPRLWPNEWNLVPCVCATYSLKEYYFHHPILNSLDGDVTNSLHSVMKWFDITEGKAFFLFYLYVQGGLMEESTKEDTAKHIRKFVG